MKRRYKYLCGTSSWLSEEQVPQQLINKYMMRWLSTTDIIKPEDDLQLFSTEVLDALGIRTRQQQQQQQQQQQHVSSFDGDETNDLHPSSPYDLRDKLVPDILKKKTKEQKNFDVQEMDLEQVGNTSGVQQSTVFQDVPEMPSKKKKKKKENPDTAKNASEPDQQAIDSVPSNLCDSSSEVPKKKKQKKQRTFFRRKYIIPINSNLQSRCCN